MQEAFDRIELIKSKEALKTVVKTKTVDSIFTRTYNPGLSFITSIVKKHHQVMSDEDPILCRCFLRSPSQIKIPNGAKLDAAPVAHAPPLFLPRP